MDNTIAILAVHTERDIIPISGNMRVPDPNWEYISPSGLRHVWVGNDVPTLQKKTKQVPVIDYVFDGEDERAVEIGTSEASVYIDPETGEEIQPAKCVTHIGESIPGMLNTWCEFGINEMNIHIFDEVNVADCRYLRKNDRAFARKLGGKWIISALESCGWPSDYRYKGKALLNPIST